MSKIKKILEIIKKPKNIVLLLALNGFFNGMSDEKYIKLIFKAREGKTLNLDNPKTYNEKLQWLKLNDRKHIYTRLVDKYEVRSFISERIGEEYLIPLIGIYDSFEEIDFDELPSKFVLKCTHNSGGLVICNDKNNFDIEVARNNIKKSLKRNYYYWGREWPYKNVKPRIICEKYMVDESGYDLKDYKFMCFNGKVKLLFVCSNRHTEEGVNINFYNRDWELMDIKKIGCKNNINKHSRPKNLEKMIMLAEQLSKDIPFIRVDFYEVHGKIYFGELTFYPDGGFMKLYPQEYNMILGDWIELPTKLV